MKDLVCGCRMVEKQTIIDAIKEGATTLEAVMEKTEAGTGCGSCVPKIEALIEENK